MAVEHSVRLAGDAMVRRVCMFDLASSTNSTGAHDQKSIATIHCGVKQIDFLHSIVGLDTKEIRKRAVAINLPPLSMTRIVTQFNEPSISAAPQKHT
jgi:hypothetical protein